MQLFQQGSGYVKEMKAIQRHMHFLNVPNDVQNRVTQFAEFMWETEHKDSTMFLNLPMLSTLKKDIMTYVLNKLVKQNRSGLNNFFFYN